MILRFKKYNEDKFIINLDSLEYFKRIEQLFFNGILLEPHYAQIDIMKKDIDRTNTVLIVPKLVRDNYFEKLKQIKVLEVLGVQSTVSYNPSNGCLKALKQMTDFFYLRQKETVFFTMKQDNNILTARVYSEDGMEIDYLTRPLGLPNNSDYVWIWHIDLPFDFEQEKVQEGQYLVNENVVEADEINNNILEVLTNRQWRVGERVLLRTDEGSWSIGLTVNDGRVRFSTGWNKFARDNELKKRQNLVFNMNEGAE
ncbi:hypothetical protein POM88_006419 [Heracleum sosnowskyi]|uniref:TF-B3 domain-containing protein n=1 Tax=Heracleum sosnowskyi TaxID=360622 RepID=A0AAD8N5E2_9APIA|nr:hypothetical protein POM88_006419 [Heracleum sosnowskyi]